MIFRLLFFQVALLLGARMVPANAQNTAPAFDLVQTVGQQLNSSVGGPTATSMMADGWGNVYLAGYYTGTVQLGATQLTTGNVPAWTQRSFLAKLDAAGAYQWATDLDGMVPTNVSRLLAVDAAGNVYLAGSYTGPSATFGPFQLACPASATSLYVLKLASDGTFLWARQAAGNSANVSGIVADRAGNVFLTGGFTSTSATFGSITLQNPLGQSIAYVAKLAANGTWQWATPSAASGYAYENNFGQCVAVDTLGNAYVGGSFGSPTITMGTTTLTNNNAYGFTCDAFVAKLDTAGRWVWAHRVGNPGYDRTQDLAVDTNGDVVLTGYLHGQVDANSWIQVPSSSGNFELFVARLAPTGTVRWAVSAGGQGTDIPSQLALDAAGNAYVTGYFESAPAYFGSATVTNAQGPYEYEAFVAKIDAAGRWQWAQQSQGTRETRGQGLTADPSGTVWIIGNCQGNNTLFSGLTQSQPGRFLARLGSAIYPTLVGGVVPASGYAGQQVTVTGAHFTGVTGVFFNKIPAISFAVLSATRLQAVVPPGATTGGVEVRTAAGGNGLAPVFQVVAPLASRSAQLVAGQVWPVPVGAERLLRLRLPAAPAAGQAGQASLQSVVGAQVRAFALPAQEVALPLAGLGAGVYVLTVRVPGQLPLTCRVVLE